MIILCFIIKGEVVSVMATMLEHRKTFIGTLHQEEYGSQILIFRQIKQSYQMPGSISMEIFGFVLQFMKVMWLIMIK